MKSLSLFLFALLCTCGAIAAPLASLHIVDRNGMSETISSKERLRDFAKVDFLASQPYQKVLRLFAKDKQGEAKGAITTYYPNGQIKQYLETVNQRAFGSYKEWHPNGQLKVESRIVGGDPDLHPQAEKSWLFDGINRVWDAEGHLLAEILYQKGELEGESRYFHPSGELWKRMPYHQNLLEGTLVLYREGRDLLLSAEYHRGERHGLSLRYWSPERIASREEYDSGKLLKASYLDKTGALLSSIEGGEGQRAVLGQNGVEEFQTYVRGVQEGEVRVIDANGETRHTYSVKNQEKQGEERFFYGSGRPKLSLAWREGRLHGCAKTWYENGVMESQREMSDNQRNGLAMAWYDNGALLLVEEYDKDRLVRGEYYRCGESMPVSRVERGEGVAMLFDAQGQLLHRVAYREGYPDI